MSKLRLVHKQWFVLAGLIVVAATLSCAQTAPPAGSPPTEDAETPLAAGGGRMALRGIIAPREVIRLSAQSAGIIQRYLVKEGDLVKKDQSLIELDRGNEEAEVKRAEAANQAAVAELAKAELDSSRAESLRKENISSAHQYEEAKLALQQATSRLAQADAVVMSAKVRLEERSVRSPINGMFFKRIRAVGEAVQRFEIVARLVDISALELVAYGSADLLGQFQTGAKQAVELMDGPGKGVETLGVITHVDEILDPATSTFRIKVELQPSASVRPGYAARLVPGGKKN